MKIAPDKWKHFYVGIALAILSFGFFRYLFPFRTATIIALSLGIVVSVSYVFELFSLVTGKGHYEMMDAIASIIGGSVGILLALLFLHFI